MGQFTAKSMDLIEQSALVIQKALNDNKPWGTIESQLSTLKIQNAEFYKNAMHEHDKHLVKMCREIGASIEKIESKKGNKGACLLYVGIILGLVGDDHPPTF